MAIRVHFNLHTKLWSVSERTPKGWRVTQNLPSLALKNARPVCSVKGRDRIVKNNRRKVVAQIEGDLIDLHCEPTIGDAIHFNPFRSAHFHLDPQNPIESVWNGGGAVYFAKTLDEPLPKGTGARAFVLIDY